MMKKIVLVSIFPALLLLALSVNLFPQKTVEPPQAMHTISSHRIMEWIDTLCNEEFAGRLGGTKGYDLSAQWVARHLKEWNIQPAGDNNTYFQTFANPYTDVLPGSEAILHIPVKKGQVIHKHYQYQTDYFPGATSASGSITAEVVYVGYGITAPELGYDEYKGLNVKGKIVMVEREVPVSPNKNADVFAKWLPYSFHQYKVKNAKKHGAAGMVYNYHIANPNCAYLEDFQLTYVGKSVINDIFSGTGRRHAQTIKRIKKNLRPRSFKTGKQMTITNKTLHHPDGKTSNVMGFIKGSDPKLENETIILGAHLDHMGNSHKLMPGANDNASGVAVIMAVAKAIHDSDLKPERSILFIMFGAEEQGVVGSKHYLEHPFIPHDKVKVFLNLDGVGRGDTIHALAAKNFPELWKTIQQANDNYIHRQIKPHEFHNRARPRLDAARFLRAGIPSISFSASGAPRLPFSTYHTTHDTPKILTPEIMEDLAQLLFISTMELAGYEKGEQQ
jgi:hypothetical protein